MKRIACGCEFNMQTLVSLCASHAKYYVDKARAGERPPPKYVTPDSKRSLRNQLLVAGVPAILTRARKGASINEAAENLIALVQTIVEKVD